MKLILTLLLLSIFTFGCVKKLDVENLNDPDIEDIYSDPESVYGVAGSLFYSWYINAQTHSWSPLMSMMVMADQGTSSWLNSGMKDLSSEPRTQLNNSESYTYAYIFENYWENTYSVLNTSNDILKVIHNGMEVGTIDANGKGADTKMVEAVSYFIQGLSIGHIGLVYDKGFIITDETKDPALETTQSYENLIAAAVASLEKCIAVSNANSFIVPSTWINGKEYTNADLSKLAHSYIARLLVYKSRNATQNNVTDWGAVLHHAELGVTSDFQIYMDNVNWKHWVFHYTYERENWVMVDARIIHMMDNNYPWHINSGANPGQASSSDARLGTDFVYTSTCSFKPERGYYHFSYYLYKRIPYTFSTPDWFPEIYVNEISLLKAEAYAQMGQLDQAITLINNGSRTSRGQLPALSTTSTKEEVLKAIFYERDLEFFVSGFGIGFFDMRRRNMLQKGTLLHFPMPSKELNVLGLPIYTFGGENVADGIGTSNGGWFPTAKTN